MPTTPSPDSTDLGSTNQPRRRRAVVRGAALAVLLVLAACSSAATQDAERNDDGQIEGESELGVLRFQVGDCFVQPDVLEGIESVDAVPCDQPHTGEVLDVYDYVGSDTFPGLAAFQEAAAEECVARFDRITGLDFFTDPDWDLTALYPSAESWAGADDREIVCIAVPLDGEPVSVSIPRR